MGGGCFERLNSTMRGFWAEAADKEDVLERVVHIKGAVLLIAESNSIPSKVNTTPCMAIVKTLKLAPPILPHLPFERGVSEEASKDSIDTW